MSHFVSGLAFERPQKPPKAAPAPSPGEKEKYLEEARTFALSLAEGLNDPDGKFHFSSSNKSE